MSKVKLDFRNPRVGFTKLDVEFDDTPIAQAVLKALDAGYGAHHAMQVRWSGRGFYIPLPEIELPQGTPESGTTHDLTIGQMVFRPGLKEMAIAYGEMRFQERNNAVDCFVIGRVLSDDKTLAALGNSIHLDGKQTVSLSD